MYGFGGQNARRGRRDGTEDERKRVRTDRRRNVVFVGYDPRQTSCDNDDLYNPKDCQAGKIDHESQEDAHWQ